MYKRIVRLILLRMKKQSIKVPKSLKTHIRREKEKIRRSGIGLQEQKEKIDTLYQGLGVVKKYDN
jgi:hypothetical protein